MKTFTVECFDSVSGKHAWSMHREAEDALQAIADSCLAEADKAAFYRAHGLAGYDDDFAEMPHPISESFTVRAEVWED